MSRLLHCISLGLLQLSLLGGIHAAPFVAPAEDNPPFRRDLLPISTDSMVTLSEDLGLLTRSLSLETAIERRAAAQSLALCLALDPANGDARDILSAIDDGKALDSPEFKKLIPAKARIWQIHAWLNTPEAGADGKLLADMLGDVAAVLDSDHPSAQELKKSPELGEWDNLIAPLAQFEDNKIAKNDAKEKDYDPFDDVKPDMPETTREEVATGPKFVLDAGEISTVLFSKDEKADLWGFFPTVVSMKVDVKDKDDFELLVPGAESFKKSINEFAAKPISNALKATYGELPATGRMEILAGNKGSYVYSRNHSAITGPGFILANSALSGQEVAGTVIAALDENNEFIAPDYMWRLVSALQEGTGGRLIVPKGTESNFLAMLAMEKPEFFLKYEVLIASGKEEFIALCAKKPSEKHAALFAKFEEIRAKSVGNPVGSYLANRFIRQRLQEIADEAPYHLSAKLLAMQGAGERPRALPKNILAAEIWRAIEPINTLTRDRELVNLGDDAIAKIEKIYDETRAEVDRLDRYADLRDRDLVTEGKDLTTTLRTLSRALRGRDDDYGKRLKDSSSAYSAMVTANTNLREKLSELSGEPLPEDKDKRDDLR